MIKTERLSLSGGGGRKRRRLPLQSSRLRLSRPPYIGRKMRISYARKKKKPTALFFGFILAREAASTSAEAFQPIAHFSLLKCHSWYVCILPSERLKSVDICHQTGTTRFPDAAAAATEQRKISTRPPSVCLRVSLRGLKKSNKKKRSTLRFQDKRRKPSDNRDRWHRESPSLSSGWGRTKDGLFWKIK